MKYKDEDIKCFNVLGFEQGFIKGEFKNLKEVYDFIKDCKRFDRNNGIEDIYLVEIETDKLIYGNFNIKKYKNNYKLVPSKVC